MLLASVACLLVFYFPIWTAKVTFFIYEGEILSLSVKDDFWLQVLAGAIGGISFVSIFFFKKRVYQIWLGWFNIFLILVFYVVTYFVSKKLDMPMARDVVTVIPKPGSYLPLITFAFTLLANFFIWKDEKLVRSANKLR